MSTAEMPELSSHRGSKGRLDPMPFATIFLAACMWVAFGVSLYFASHPLVMTLCALCASAATATALLSDRHAKVVVGLQRWQALSQGADPTFLVAPDGTITARNTAANALAPDATDIAAALVGAADVEERQLYKLGRAADSNGLALAEVTWAGRPATLAALRTIGSNPQVWTLRQTPLPHAEAGERARSAGAEGVLPDSTLEDLPVALARLDRQGEIQFVNAAAHKLLGAEFAPGANIGEFLEGLARPIPQRLADTVAGKAQGRSEVARGRQKDGYFQVTMSRTTANGKEAVLAVLNDATELKTLEAQFVQSQKMQAVGQLAGGVAHDFNNLLTAINGHCDLLLLRHVQGDGDHADLMQIRQNSNRAASLVRQLLAFSRKQTLRPEVLHLFDTLAELANLLNRLLGEKVTLTLDIDEDIAPVRVDERQLEQVIVNLVVNARDAMSAGGTVTLRTRTEYLHEAMERDRAIVPPGRYSLIEVEDTGSGIPPDKIRKIFEPFFTTKKVGEGTGLGLSTAYGIIKQMDGYIFVDSTVGEGSRFTIYLPAAEDVPRSIGGNPEGVAQKAEFRDPTGRGVVLLVEDEAPVRSFAARALQMRGYTVLEADSGEMALEMLEDGTAEVDLFVSDVVMPGIDGPTWVRKAYESYPAASTIFVSGYSQDQFADGQPQIPRSSYLAKPFTLDDLTERVREHMERYVEAPDTADRDAVPSETA